MKRDFLHIGYYHYLVDYFSSTSDNVNYLSEFVMLRNFSLTNNVACDKDIMFIEKSIFNEYIKELKENGESNIISFPVTNSKTMNFSTSLYDFNDIYTEDSLYVEENGELKYGFDVYELYDKKGNNIYIPCNKIRIYHPLLKRSIDGIVYIDNYINNIHFHYVCRQLDNYDSNSSSEIKLINNTYSEYFDIYFPNIEELFKEENDNYNVYYKENLDIVASTNNAEFLNKILSSGNLSKYNNDSGDQLCPLSLLIHPFRIIEEYNAENSNNFNDTVADDDKHFVKLYINNERSIENNYLTYSFNFTLFIYEDINENTKKYTISSEYFPGVVVFSNENKFKIYSKLGFSDGILSIITKFGYPNTEYWNLLYSKDKTTTPIKEAYKFYNNIDENDYPVFIHPDIQKMFDDIDEITELTENEKQITRELGNVSYVDDKLLLLKFKQLKKEAILEEYKDLQEINQNFIGFKIDIYSDLYFKHNIYSKEEKIRLADLDDFAFKLNNIFNSWIEKPNELLIRIKFIDRYLNIELSSNIIVINKEWFKYMINDKNIYRSEKLTYFNDNEFYASGDNEFDKKIKDEYDMKFIDLTKSRVYTEKKFVYDDKGNVTGEEYVPVLPNLNFINNINCVITNVSKDNNIKSISENLKGTNFIYKPIFYKVQDLQNIKIREGVTQNIGINLVNYMTKVDTFKLVLDNTEYIESGRNDIYVIFNIPAVSLTSVNGKYNITDQDDTYISSGNWSLY